MTGRLMTTRRVAGRRRESGDLTRVALIARHSRNRRRRPAPSACSDISRSGELCLVRSGASKLLKTDSGFAGCQDVSLRSGTGKGCPIICMGIRPVGNLPAQPDFRQEPMQMRVPGGQFPAGNHQFVPRDIAPPALRLRPVPPRDPDKRNPRHSMSKCPPLQPPPAAAASRPDSRVLPGPLELHKAGPR